MREAITGAPNQPDGHPPPDQVPELRRQFPSYEIWRESAGERVSYNARRRDPRVTPHTLVTTDPGELRDVLATEQARRDDVRAISNDYPGWTVTAALGRWTASCPAMSLHADTPAGLRAAIEEAICPDDTSPF